MKILRGASCALAALLFAGCDEKPKPIEPLPGVPVISAFTATPTRIEPGESATLAFTAEHATEVELLDGAGAPVPLTGDASAGSATVTPERSEVYLLRVKGPGGRDNAFARVGVGEALGDVFIAAIPAEVSAGDPAQLLWSAFRATDARIEISSGGELVLDPVARASGVIEVSPERTTTYRLVADGVGGETKSSETTVTALATIEEFHLSSQAAKVGESITATWRTRGASEIVLSEATFGELMRASAPAETSTVDQGSFEWTVPQSLPSGLEVIDGLPLRFALTVRQVEPEREIEQRIKAFVGEGPRIDELSVPSAVTAGHRVPISWSTTNAVQVQLRVNGLLVFETLPGDLARAASGSFELGPIAEDLAVTLVARSFAGTTSSETRAVSRVPGPQILSFDMPLVVNAPADGALATWTTSNATYVALRPVGGAVAFATNAAADVAQGQATVYPGHTITWVLEAWNAAGDRITQEALVQVNNPGSATATPSPALPGTPVQLEWQFSGADTQDLVGLPNETPIPELTSAVWLELDGHVDAQEVFFADSNDALTRLEFPLPFRFPLVDGLRDTLYVSTNGFVTFGDTGPMLGNVDLTTSGAPEVIAPFWDNLDLGASGKVLYLVDRTSFPRRLTVQWNKVTLVGNAAAELTFQVQLEETGAVRFAYLDLSGVGSAGESATIGVRVSDGVFVGQLGHETATVTAGQAFVWFGGAALTGSLELVTRRTSFYGFFQVLQGGRLVSYSLPVWVFAPESLSVSEVMPEPGPGAAQGRWIELYNSQNVPVNVGGVKLTTTGMAQPLELPSMILPARSYVVFGESKDPAENGGAPVDHLWTGVTLANADAVSLEILGSTLSSLSWPSAVAGESVQVPERAIKANGDPYDCQRTRTFGNGFVGTPGEANEVCFEYAVKPIPGEWEDITATGTVLYQTSGASAFRHGTLPVPFTYFGQPYTDFSVSTGGFMTLGYVLTATHHATNDTVPGSAQPNGVIAPFWDEMLPNSSNATLGTKVGSIMMERKSSYTVVAWDNFRIWGETASRLYFQVKLFDSGIIEFHYGEMTPPSATSTKATYNTGTSATTWIEKVDGSAALPVNINTLNGIQADSGWRFTPNQ